MMLRLMVVLLVAVVTLGVSGTGRAHSGGLAAKGCHAGSQPYHCHRPQTPTVRAPAPVVREPLTNCVFGSRIAACTDRPASQMSLTVSSSAGLDSSLVATIGSIAFLQERLILHCPSLAGTFTYGGVEGTMTYGVIDDMFLRALTKFREAYMISEEDLLGPRTLEALFGPSLVICE